MLPKTHKDVFSEKMSNV